MTRSDEREQIRRQWENAAPGWTRWEPVVAAWMAPATEVMLDMGGVKEGSKVLDLACGAGSQTLRAAERVGPRGLVVANDIAEPMLRHVRETVAASNVNNVTTLAGSAEELDLDSEGFDAVVCRLGLMLFAEPEKAIAAAYRALRPGGRIAAVVFTSPQANRFMAEPMVILLRHAGKAPPTPGRPGIFALGAPGKLEGLLEGAGFGDVEARVMNVDMRLSGADEVLLMMQEGWGAYRAVLAGTSDAVQAQAWSEVHDFLRGFEATGEFVASAEVLAVAAAKGW